MAGLQDATFTVPAQWDARWFQTFVRDVLAKADTRNAVGTPGVIVEGTTNTVATISYVFSDGSQQLANRAFAGPSLPTPTIESQALNLAAFLRPNPTLPPVNDTQAVLAMEIFS